MTKSELVTEVSRLVRDSGVSDATILLFLNRGMLEIAGRVALPDLETTGSVTATSSADTASLPSDYHGGPYRSVLSCYSTTTKRHPEIRDSRALIEADYHVLGQTGPVVQVAVHGGLLFYAQRADETLTVGYYKKPTAMSAADDEPDGLFEDEHYALVHYAAWRAYEGNELAGDQIGANLQYHRAEWKEWLGRIELRAGPPKVYPERRSLRRGRQWRKMVV